MGNRNEFFYKGGKPHYFRIALLFIVLLILMLALIALSMRFALEASVSEEPFQEGEAGYGLVFEDPDNELASFCEWTCSPSVMTRKVHETKVLLFHDLGYMPEIREDEEFVEFILLNGILRMPLSSDGLVPDVFGGVDFHESLNFQLKLGSDVIPGGFWRHWDSETMFELVEHEDATIEDYIRLYMPDASVFVTQNENQLQLQLDVFFEDGCHIVSSYCDSLSKENISKLIYKVTYERNEYLNRF